MKRFIWLFLLLTFAVPSWAAKRITVGQLEDLLHSLQQAKKTDAEVADELRQIELSEELTRGTMNSLIGFVAGPLSTEQIYVLEARSADLVPPARDLPSTAAPNAAEQQGMLNKAAAYVIGTYNRLPSLTASKATLRFQDNIEAVAASSGVVGSTRDAVTSFGLSDTASFFRFINSSEITVAIERGVERPQAKKDKISWGANKMIELREPAPALGAIFEEAQAGGTIEWLRWELVSGRPVGVFSFAAPKKTAGLSLDICCFPNINQTGVARFYTSTTAIAVAGNEAAPGGGGGVAGNFQTNTDWYDFKSDVPYHGEFFIDPTTGIVVRMIVEAELKPADVVHQVDTRIDYGAVKAGGMILVAPVRTIVNIEVVPNGDSGAGKYSTRRTLFTSEFTGYK
jgi:hypothetical protein